MEYRPFRINSLYDRCLLGGPQSSNTAIEGLWFCQTPHILLSCVSNISELVTLIYGVGSLLGIKNSRAFNCLSAPKQPSLKFFCDTPKMLVQIICLLSQFY